MNSKLEDILEELWEYGFNSNGDFPTEHKSKYVRTAEAEKAIRQAVAEDMLELVSEDEQIRVKKNTHGNCCQCQDCGEDHDDCNCWERKERNQWRAELRQKIKEWSQS